MPVVIGEAFAYAAAYLVEAVGLEAASAIITVLEYAAVAELLNAAQSALTPSAKTGIGAGLESNQSENDDANL